MLKETTFTYKGRYLSVRAAQYYSEFVVRVFAGNTRATAVAYTISIETELDGKLTGLDLSMVDQLMALAKSDVVEGRVTLHDM